MVCGKAAGAQPSRHCMKSKNKKTKNPETKREKTENQIKHQNQIKDQKTIVHYRVKEWGMVFFLVLVLPYIISIFWSGSEYGGSGKVLEDEPESRIFVEVERKPGVSLLSMEEYLCGALPAVIPADFEPECLKAQAILLRTSLVRKYKELVESQSLPAVEGNAVIMTSSVSVNEAGFSQNLYLEETSRRLKEPEASYLTREQMKKLWGNDFSGNYQKIRQAVMDTKGICAVYQGVPVEACFFAVSIGSTRNGSEVLNREIPYLQSTACPKDYLSEEYLTQIIFKRRKIEKLIGGVLEAIQTDSLGYCRKVTILRKDGVRMEKSGEWFRETLGLASSYFQVREQGTELYVTVKGRGHGLGMSQFGANEMAKEGKDCMEILLYFFHGIALDKYQ